MAGIDEVHAHVQAGSFSRYRGPHESEHGIRHDDSDAGRPDFDSSRSFLLIPGATKDVLFDPGRLVVALIVTMLIEVPIVKQIVTWTAGTLPGDWQRLRDRWVAFHSIRVTAGIGGVVFLVAGAIFG